MRRAVAAGLVAAAAAAAGCSGPRLVPEAEATVVDAKSDELLLERPGQNPAFVAVGTRVRLIDAPAGGPDSWGANASEVTRDLTPIRAKVLDGELSGQVVKVRPKNLRPVAASR